MYSGADALEALEAASNYNYFLRQIVLSRVRSSDSVLDFGAGTGDMASRILPYVSDLIAIEPDAELARVISGRGLKVADLADIPIESVDVVYSFNVLEHIQDDKEIAQRLVSRLRPGGTLILYVPAGPNLFSEFDKRIGHFRRYTRDLLNELVEGLELTQVDVRYHDPIGYWAAYLYKKFDNSGQVSLSMIRFFDTVVFPLSKLMERLFRLGFGKNLSLVGKKIGA